jgi:hypothetical protein
VRTSVSAVVVVAALALGASASAAAPARVSTSLAPRWLYFGDHVTAHVDVLFDERQLDPASVRLETSFAPWEQIDRARVSTMKNGTTEHRSWTFTLACLSIDCVPRGTAVQRFHVPAVTVMAQTLGGGSVAIHKAWSTLRVAGRFSPTTTPGLRPVFRVNAAPPAPRYRVDPGGLTIALLAIGTLLVGAALVVVGVETRRWLAGRKTTVAPAPLVRALTLLREAKQREPEDRRRAASFVARTLPRTGNGLASQAAEVAWSPDDPAPDRLEGLARAVEAELEEPA